MNADDRFAPRAEAQTDGAYRDDGFWPGFHQTPPRQQIRRLEHDLDGWHQLLGRGALFVPRKYRDEAWRLTLGIALCGPSKNEDAWNRGRENEWYLEARGLILFRRLAVSTHATVKRLLASGIEPDIKQRDALIRQSHTQHPGWSQGRLARYFGVNQSTVSRVLRRA